MLVPRHWLAVLRTTCLGLLACSVALGVAPVPPSWDEAVTLWRQGQSADAAAVLRRQGALHALADLHAFDGDHAAARDVWTEIVAARSRILGSDHWSVADARVARERMSLLERIGPAIREGERLMRLAERAHDQGRSREAIALAQRALLLRQRLLGPGHLDCAECHTDLGILHAATGNGPQARRHLVAASRLVRAGLGETHPRHVVALYNLAQVHQRMGDFHRAGHLLRQALAIRLEVPGDGYPQVGEILFTLATTEYQMGGVRHAVARLHQLVALDRSTRDERDPTRIQHLRSLVAVLGKVGRSAEALPLREELVRLTRAPSPGPEQVQAFRRITQEAVGHRREKRIEQATASTRKVLSLLREYLPEDHAECADWLNVLATLLEERGRFDQASQTRKDEIALLRRLHGPTHWQVRARQLVQRRDERLADMGPWRRRLAELATRLNDQTETTLRQGQPARALPLARETLALRLRLLGEDDPDTAQALNNLAVVHLSGADASTAVIYLERALASWRSALGNQHPDTIKGLGNLSGALHALGRYLPAREMLERALVVAESAHGKDHLLVGVLCNNLGGLLEEMGDHVTAERHYLRSLAIHEKQTGKETAATATLWNNLGLLARRRGDHAGARERLEMALRIRKARLSPRHPLTAQTIDNLGLVFSDMGDLELALDSSERALGILRAAYGNRHAATARALANAAARQQDAGDLRGARKRLEESLSIAREVHGEQHALTASTLNLLGCLDHHLGDREGAVARLSRAHAIREKHLGKDHPDTLTSVANLGVLHGLAGRIDEGRKLLIEVLTRDRELFGDQHPRVARDLHNLGNLALRAGQFPQAEKHLAESLRITEGQLERASVAQSERQQLAMARSQRSTLDLLLSLPGRPGSSAEAAYEHVLAWKGAVFTSQWLMRSLSDEPELASLLRDLSGVAGQLASLSQVTPPPQQRAGWSATLQDLTREKERIEGALARQSDRFRKGRDLARASLLSVRAALPAGTALVDFLEYAHHHRPARLGGPIRTEARLVAFVVRPGRAVVRHDLGPASLVSGAVEQWRTGLSRRTRPAEGDDDPAVLLRKQVWQPLTASLEGATVVLLSPDGALCRLPFAALPGKVASRYLIEEVALAQLPVPRLLPGLVTPPQPRKKPDREGAPSLLLVGDVAFGDQAEGKWPALPGAKAEASALRGLFGRHHPGGRLRFVRGEEATRTTVREEFGRHRWAHLATHGYFAPGGLTSALKERGDDVFGRGGVAGWNPGLLSGLVLAGANLEPTPGKDGGILTASEVSASNLFGVELVVLSACETGLGTVAGGEGVLGLQRAFQVAGARATVCSLWQVPDEATRVLMERFYASLWTGKRSRLDALREAQCWLIREGKRHPEVVRGMVRRDVRRGPTTTGPTPPYYWAAFVLSGDWR